MWILHGLPLLCLCCICLAEGCSVVPSINGSDLQPQQTAQKAMTMQIIIKFRDQRLDPSQDSFMEGLSRDANTSLVFVRPMSGGAYVFRVENIADDTHLANVIQRLSKRADILYVEQDAIMRHHIK